MQNDMKRLNILKTLFVLFSALLLPLTATGQTTRGDFNYDGTTGMDDLTALINYLVWGTWEDPSVPSETVTVNGVSFVMVHVEGGTYAISEGVTGTVSDFSIGQTEVTHELWTAVMGTTITHNPSPKNNVSWNDCQEFITRLNELTGKNFRLPSKVEWGFATRGGNRSHGYLYSGGNQLNLVGWSQGNILHNVALLKANELNLYDMSGNVSEWCSDIYPNPYTSYHWFRGGDTVRDPSYCLLSWGGSYTQDTNSYIWLGFRLAM